MLKNNGLRTVIATLPPIITRSASNKVGNLSLII